MDDLLRFLKNTLKSEIPLQVETPLLSSGIIGSLQFTALLAALEQQYGVKIDPSDVGSDNFDTARQIHQFLQSQSG